MIEVKNVTKRFPQGKSLFQDLGFVMQSGEFFYVTGPSGAGKTSLLHLIYGVSQPSGGEVIVEGKSLYKLKGFQRALLRRRMGFVFQDYRLVSHFNIEKNIGLPLAIQKVGTRVIAAEVDRVMERVGISGIRSALPEELSGGEQQKVAIARAIIHRPQWLLADEPTGNLDPLSTQEILKLFREIHLQGTSIIVATHDEELIRHGDATCIRIEDGGIRGTYSC